MSQNKRTIQKYLEGFAKTDHAEILSCLTDDVEWVGPAAFHTRGKDAFNKQLENSLFVGSPTITVTRMTEENDVIATEGSLRCASRDGGFISAVFCDVFVMQNAKIRHLTLYVVAGKV